MKNRLGKMFEQIQRDCLSFRMWKVIWVSMLEVHCEWSWIILTSILASIFVLYSSSLLAIVVFPLEMAWWRAVSPLKSTRWGSASCVSNVGTHFMLSRWVAYGYCIKNKILNSRTWISIPTITLNSHPWIRPIVKVMHIISLFLRQGCNMKGPACWGFCPA